MWRFEQGVARHPPFGRENVRLAQVRGLFTNRHLYFDWLVFPKRQVVYVHILVAVGVNKWVWTN